ncbi:FtsW/RodA/SpoVE family cell cycle protein [Demequina sp. NBRC 110056]|uniref:FtsW/RodA/SpoVE family cell cycle protein n=1 Tax=Demequina sp. NBRC 110056 TaxID=1570345 RepID=UPI000A0607D4|nr:FtsW/RodA/SpoVE family cell cycle protein [Demequina sp. NBRC 110056]
MATVAELEVRAGRRAELGLLTVAWSIIVLSRALVDYHADFLVLSTLGWYALGAAVLMVACHIILRRYAPQADPVLLPAVFALNGVGLAMIRRIDFAYAQYRGRDTDFGTAQIGWSIAGVVLAMVVILIIRDHRKLRRFTYTAGIVGLVLYLLPLVPGLGVEINGARIWISVLGRSLQPGEFAKIAMVVFFAGYLVTNRDTLALAGPKFLGLRFPRPRDMGPLLVVWAAALLLMVYERDLGASLLFFGIFLGMLYVATQRISWVITGLALFAVGAVAAGVIFPHVRARYDGWLHALDPEVYSSGTSYQLVGGLFGMASGGLFGTGLGEGRPDLVPYAESDFIIASLGEELGLTGLMAILALYLIIVQRAFRMSIGVRDGFGKLLAAGLGFALALQVFIVVGGVTRVIPLTGLTTPWLAYGGSSMLANWIVVGLLLRISDQARRSSQEVGP